jgi:hypothetical protein
MRQKRKVEMEGETTKEDSEHGHPFEIFDETGPETFFGEAVAKDSKGYVTHGAEDDDKAEEDFPGFQVEFIEVAIKPADKEVVHDCEGKAGRQGVV